MRFVYFMKMGLSLGLIAICLSSLELISPGVLTFDLSDEEDSSLHSTAKGTRHCVFAVAEIRRQEQEGLIFAYKRNGDLSDSPFYGAKNVGSGKFGDIIFIPRSAKWTSTRS